MSLIDPHIDDEEDDDFIDGTADLATPGDDDDVSIEDRARAMGWKPFEEYRGAARAWRSAEEFVAESENEMPVLRQQLRQATERLARFEPQMDGLRKTVSEQAAALEDLANLAKRADKRGYDRAMEELKARREEAVDAGDKEAFNQVQEQIDTLTEERAAAPAEPAPPAAPAAPRPMDPPYVAFVAANPWINTDRQLNMSIIGHHNTIMARHPDMPVAEQLELARAAVVADFPDHPAFAQEPPMARQPEQRRAAAAPVARPGGGAPLREPRQSSGWAQITDPAERAEAQAAFERIKRQQPKMTAQEYIAIYLDPHGDVLTMQTEAAARRK